MVSESLFWSDSWDGSLLPLTAERALGLGLIGDEANYPVPLLQSKANWGVVFRTPQQMVLELG